jgi:acetyltransferase-like isoleucine patch superfamily enzyme
MVRKEPKKMRQITLGQIGTFLLLLTLTALIALSVAWFAIGALPLGEFRAIAIVVSAIIALYLVAFVVYRAFLSIVPLQEGHLPAGSRAEFAAQVNILFYLVLFNSLIRTHFVPVPLLRLVYLALGAKLGKNTYSAGVLLDPPLTFVGDNCIIGHDAVIFAHAIEGPHMALAAVRIGNNVTIGATAVVMSDVTIGDGSIISAGAVVTKGTKIGAGEVWGGMPARRLKAAAF